MSGVSLGGGVNTTTQRDIPRILIQSAIPFILAGGTAGAGTNQFTMGNNGAISTLPTLPTTFSGGAWIYMPANAVAAGVAAGWYWFVASSATAGTVYNNTYTSGDPRLSVPTSPTAFATTGPGVVTQSTSAITTYSITVPGGALGLNGLLRVNGRFEANNNANAKTVSFLFGTGSSISGALASSLTGGLLFEVRNINSYSRQVCTPRSFSSPYGGSTNASQYGTDDTSTDKTLSASLQLSTTTDYLIHSSLDAILQYGA